jgi:hypothetical protein
MSFRDTLSLQHLFFTPLSVQAHNQLEILLPRIDLLQLNNEKDVWTYI